MTGVPPKKFEPKPKARKVVAPRAHGWSRADDTNGVGETASDRARRRAPAGTSFLLFVVVAVLTALGVVRVHASTRVLELGGEITKLTSEQAQLLDIKRRLGAERAFLRHPDQIDNAARDELGMVPVPPERIQNIRLLPKPRPAPSK